MITTRCCVFLSLLALSPLAAHAGGKASAAASVETFRRAWAKLFARLDPERARWLKGVDELVRDPHGPLEVRAEACRARRDFIRSNVREIDKLVLAGTLAALDRDGACSVVFVAGGMKREVEAVLTADGREVLLVWLVPEG